MSDKTKELWDALKAHGMVERSCACGQVFLTRSDDPLCPPCRVLASEMLACSVCALHDLWIEGEPCTCPEAVAEALGADEYGTKH